MSGPTDDTAAGTSGDKMVAHLLSVDVEEYFQVEAAARHVEPGRWHAFERRLGPPIEQILRLLDEHQASATFFVLGWVARHDPALVRRIAEAGHEVASHGMSHAMVARLGPDAFRAEVDESRALLQDLSGQPVRGYRAPTFSITRATAWALDVLAECGFEYDSSVFPVRHDRYGVPDAPTSVHRAVGPGGGRILEIPPVTLRLLGHNLPVGGGGYLRLLPVRVLGCCLATLGARGLPGMVYVHPWELDPEQPHLPMGRLARWRHRVALRRTETKLRWLLGRFRFTGAARSLDLLRRLAPAEFHYGRPA